MEFLIRLDISYKNISQVFRYTLKHATAVLELLFSHNATPIIHVTVFNILNITGNINVSANRLNSICYPLFKIPLVFQSLNVAHNYDNSPDMFAPLYTECPILKYVSYHILRLSSDLFPLCMEIYELNISYNDFTHNESGVFKNIKNLHYVYIST